MVDVAVVDILAGTAGAPEVGVVFVAANNDPDCELDATAAVAVEGDEDDGTEARVFIIALRGGTAGTASVVVVVAASLDGVVTQSRLLLPDFDISSDTWNTNTCNTEHKDTEQEIYEYHFIRVLFPDDGDDDDVDDDGRCQPQHIDSFE